MEWPSHGTIGKSYSNSMFTSRALRVSQNRLPFLLSRYLPVSLHLVEVQALFDISRLPEVVYLRNNRLPTRNMDTGRNCKMNREYTLIGDDWETINKPLSIAWRKRNETGYIFTIQSFEYDYPHCLPSSCVSRTQDSTEQVVLSHPAKVRTDRSNEGYRTKEIVMPKTSERIDKYMEAMKATFVCKKSFTFMLFAIYALFMNKIGPLLNV